MARTLVALAPTFLFSGCFVWEALASLLGARQAPVTAAPRVELVLSTNRLTLVPGGTASTQVSVSLVGGVTEATLALGGSLPAGVMATFTPSVLTGNGTSTLTLDASPSAAAGLFIFDVAARGLGGTTTVSSTASVTGEVMRPFRILNPGSRSLGAGSAVDVPVGINRADGFTGPVTFAVDPATTPAGTTATWTPPVTTGSAATLRLEVPSAAPTGQYLVRTLATAGANADTTLWLMTVAATLPPPDITILAAPDAATLVPGGSATVGLTFTRTQPGLGNIGLAATGLPPGATATFTPQFVPGTTAQLVLATTAATPDGVYPVTITATAGAIVKQATVTLTVRTPPDFALTVAPGTLTVAQGASGQATVSIQRTGNPGAVAIDVTGLPAGVTAAANPATVSGGSSVVTLAVAAAAQPGTYPLTVRGVAGPLTRTVPLSLVIPAPPPPSGSVVVQLGSANVTIGPRGTAQVPVRLTRTGTAVGRLLELRVAGFPPGGIAWVTPNFITGDTATLQIIGGTPGTVTTTVTAVLGAALPSAAVNVTVTGATTPDFSLLPTPREFNIARSSPFTPFTVEILRANGFSGSVAFSAITDQPGAYAVNFMPSATSANSVIAEIYVSELVPPGYHVVTIRGVSGGITRTAHVTVLVR